MTQYRTVAIAGLGAIGGFVARALLQGEVPGLSLAAASARDEAKGRAALGPGGENVPLLPMRDLAAQADIILESLPPARFDDIATPAVEAGKFLMVMSAGALLKRGALIDRAKETGARILVPTGAILGLDAIRAAAEGAIETVRIVTRKPPAGLAGAPYLTQKGVDIDNLTESTKIYEGTVSEAIGYFPANVNVAAAVSLAGIGLDRTMIEVWADPSAVRNSQSVTVSSDCTTFTVTIESVPSPDNPRTSLMTPRSVIAALRRHSSHFVVGT